MIDRKLMTELAEGKLASIRRGNRVTIVDRFGKKKAGYAVMKGPHGWVLNMGGRHGTPAIASDDNIVKVTKGRAQTEDRDLTEAGAPLRQGQLKRGMKIQDGDELWVVMNASPKRATLQRFPSNSVDTGAKLHGKGMKLVLNWDGTGYGKNKYKGAYQKKKGDPKIYVHADGIY